MEIVIGWEIVVETSCSANVEEVTGDIVEVVLVMVEVDVEDVVVAATSCKVVTGAIEEDVEDETVVDELIEGKVVAASPMSLQLEETLKWNDMSVKPECTRTIP